MGKVKKPYLFTRTKSRTKRDKKDRQIQKLTGCIDDYPYVYVVECLRGDVVNKLSRHMQDSSRTFKLRHKIAKRAFIQISTQTPEYSQIAKLNDYLLKDVFVLYSNKTPQELGKEFTDFFENDIPVPGALCHKTLILKPGKIKGLFWYDEEFFAINSIPIKIIDRELHVTSNYTVCREGAILSSKQTKILNRLKTTPVSDQDDFPWMSFSCTIKIAWARDTNKIVNF